VLPAGSTDVLPVWPVLTKHGAPLADDEIANDGVAPVTWHAVSIGGSPMSERYFVRSAATVGAS